MAVSEKGREGRVHGPYIAESAVPVIRNVSGDV